MHLCVQPTEFGWQAADEDSLDCDQDYDGHKTYSGQFAHGDTRKQALEALREVYVDILAEGPTKAVSFKDAQAAVLWIDNRLAEEKKQDDEFFNLAVAICHGGSSG